MKIRRWAFVPLLAFAIPPQGCDANRSDSNEATGALGEAIGQGDPVDQDANPISLQFPLTTVVLLGGEAPSSRCTGVILSRTLIMTAAHCLPKVSTTLVNFYGTASPDPIKGLAGVSQVVSVAMPAGITGQDPYPGGVTNAQTQLVDLAILTISPPIAASVAIAPVHLAPANSYADVFADPTWAVGAGTHNGTDNGALELDWVPIQPSSQDDLDGSFLTERSHLNNGDSGGPAFQLAKDGSLTLIGIASGTVNAFFQKDRYTSVSFGTTWSWIQSQIFPAGP